ncbi:carbohydrate sulfotransferase 4-like isoform X2 [Oratosquilla oratoria]
MLRTRLRKAIWLSPMLFPCLLILCQVSNNISKMEFQDSRDVPKGAIGKPASTEKMRTYPRQIVLWTSWRSGSSFTGTLLANAVNKTYYSYEPLHMRGPRILKEQESIGAIEFMKTLLLCEMYKIPYYVSYTYRKSFFLEKNKYLRDYLQMKDNESLETMEEACRNANVHLSKVIRLKVAYSRKLLEDPSLDIQIVHLIRDPRAVYNSRKSQPWCKERSCRDIDTVCSILWEDVQQIKQLQRDFPTKYMVIRYEDLSLQLNKKLKEVFDFLSWEFTEHTKQTFEKYTKVRNMKELSTYNHTFAWRDSIPFEKVQEIQSACSESLKYLGYRNFDTAKDLRNMTLPVLVKNSLGLPTYE